MPIFTHSLYDVAGCGGCFSGVVCQDRANGMRSTPSHPGVKRSLDGPRFPYAAGRLWPCETFCCHGLQELTTGKIYGVLTWRGKTDGQERRIRGTLKRDWRYLTPRTPRPLPTERVPMQISVNPWYPHMAQKDAETDVAHPLWFAPIPDLPPPESVYSEPLLDWLEPLRSLRQALLDPQPTHTTSTTEHTAAPPPASSSDL